ncbi:MAG: alanine racemase [Burkholderiales bacterium]
MRPLTATIDLSALRHNLGVVRRHAPRSKVFAVIKANAYGHGLLRVARALEGADGFAVVELESAVRLREAGYRQKIALLEGIFDPRELPVLTEHRLVPAIHTVEQIEMLSALSAGCKLDVLLKVNTGMNRLGFQPSQFGAALERLQSGSHVSSITLMTHFANADDARGIAEPLQTLEGASAGVALPRTLANSAAIMRYPEAHADWVRPGIMLYGCSPFPNTVAVDVGLRPAMTLASEVIAVRELSAGDAVGYGSTWVAERAARVAVVACGYADGYPRHAPTGTPVLVGARLTRTVGRVSMDMLCVDVSGIEAVRVGTPVVLWGEGNPVENIAEAAGTVGYELLCALAPRVRVAEKP